MSLSRGREGFALKISIAHGGIWSFPGKDAIFSGGRRHSHYSSTAAIPSPGPLPGPVPSCPFATTSRSIFALIQPLPSGLLFGIPSPPTSTCFCHLGEATQVAASAPLPGIHTGQPMLTGLNGASSKYIEKFIHTHIYVCI